MACEEQEPLAVLGDSSSFVAPVLSNAATADPKELSVDNATQVYELFQWSATQYGVTLSTTYTLQIAVSDDFADAKTLATTSSTSSSISVDAMNTSLLTMGLPGFEEATVYIRVRSVINGFSGEGAPDALYSGTITRVATPFETSECGNYCTIGLIGSASPGGWDVDVDMRHPDPNDKFTWGVTVYLTAGNAVKFRASDGWDVNWGAATFPTGTGTQNGSDIPISSSGYYKITFNDVSGDYSFTALSTSTYTSVGIIGSGTAGGWDSDTDLTQDSNDPHVWSGTFTLTDGEAKFRANDDWANNWGESAYPAGYGVGNGPNIPVGAGTYFVRFNDASGLYMFAPSYRSNPYTTIGIIGPAQEGGWDADTDMIKNPANPYMWSKIITLSEGEAKFRAENDWGANWGASGFPGAIGAQDGPNIPAKSGTYFVTFNTGTGEYYFLR